MIAAKLKQQSCINMFKLLLLCHVKMVDGHCNDGCGYLVRSNALNIERGVHKTLHSTVHDSMIIQIFILLMKSNSRMPWNGRHVVYFSVNFKGRSLITYLVLVVFWFIWWHFFSCFFFRLDDSFLILPQITNLTLYTNHLSFRIVISVFMYTTRVLVPIWKCHSKSNLLTIF